MSPPTCLPHHPQIMTSMGKLFVTSRAAFDQFYIMLRTYFQLTTVSTPPERNPKRSLSSATQTGQKPEGFLLESYNLNDLYTRSQSKRYLEHF